MAIPGPEVRMIQINGKKRQVFIKVNNAEILEEIITRTLGTLTYEHKEGIISHVKIGMAGLGGRRIRVANLPPEMQRAVISRALETYGTVGKIRDEMWSKSYHYKVCSGVLLVHIDMTKHIPSHMMIGENRALITYEGQPMTCYACNASGHLIQKCPVRQRTERRETVNKNTAWATLIDQEEGRVQALTDRTGDMRLKNSAQTETESRESGREEVTEWKGQKEQQRKDVMGVQTTEGTDDKESLVQSVGVEEQEKMDVEDKNNDKMVEGDKFKGEKVKHGNVTGTTKRSITGRREGTNNNMGMGGLTQ
jgi:hypothetical protein